jgi:hypothetical protein
MQPRTGRLELYTANKSKQGVHRAQELCFPQYFCVNTHRYAFRRLENGDSIVQGRGETPQRPAGAFSLQAGLMRLCNCCKYLGSSG